MIFRLISAECRMTARTGFQMLAPAMFLLLAAILVPMTQMNGVNIPSALAHGSLWLAVIFASLSGIQDLFIRDAEDGSLSLYAQSKISMTAYAFAKLAAHWITHILPMICMLPVAAGMLSIPTDTWLHEIIMIGLASFWLIWLGGVIAAILATQPQSGLLLPFLGLPMMIPAVIFGAAGQFYWLAALCMLAFMLAPAAIAAILRGAEENY